MVLLVGTLANKVNDGGRVYACPRCDVPDKPVSKEAKNIIQLSKRKANE
jgi:hypothetical protein